MTLPISPSEESNKSPRQAQDDTPIQTLPPVALKNVESEFDETIKQLEYELQQPLPPVQFWHKFTFVMLGIASLAGWNAVLTAFDFFSKKYPKDEGYLDVTFYFPIPIMITNFFAGLACPALAKKFSYNQRIAYLSVGVCITMITITLIAIFYNTKGGFWLSFCILFFQGFIESVVTNSLIALAGMISPQINSIYWTCTALSGLVMNFIRLAALGALGDSDSSMNLCTALYFSIACIIYLTSSCMQMAFTRSEYFKAIENRAVIQGKIESRQNEIAAASASEGNLQTVNGFSASNLDAQNEKKAFRLKDTSFIQYLIYLSQVFKYAGAIPIYLVFIYIQTFMMFPGVSIFQKPSYTIIPNPWAIVFMITIYNAGDLIGKYIGGIKVLVRLYFIYAVVLFRFVYYILFLMTAHSQGGSNFQNDVFAWSNMLVFAITNGFCTTGLMNLGPLKAKDPKMINLINFIGGFSITFGIAIGTFLALPLAQE